jgi:hypothetical protein
MRTSSALILIVAVAGCSADTEQPQAEPGAERIECALGKGAEFAADCLIERSAVDGARILTVRHPDGGMRRFEQVEDGRGLIVADGADEAKLDFADEVLEVTVASDRYRFPATPDGAATNDAGASD